MRLAFNALTLLLLNDFVNFSWFNRCCHCRLLFYLCHFLTHFFQRFFVNISFFFLHWFCLEHDWLFSRSFCFGLRTLDCFDSFSELGYFLLGFYGFTLFGLDLGRGFLVWWCGFSFRQFTVNNNCHFRRDGLSFINLLTDDVRCTGLRFDCRRDEFAEGSIRLGFWLLPFACFFCGFNHQGLVVTFSIFELVLILHGLQKLCFDVSHLNTVDRHILKTHSILRPGLQLHPLFCVDLNFLGFLRSGVQWLFNVARFFCWCCVSLSQLHSFVQVLCCALLFSFSDLRCSCTQHLSFSNLNPLFCDLFIRSSLHCLRFNWNLKEFRFLVNDSFCFFHISLLQNVNLLRLEIFGLLSPRSFRRFFLHLGVWRGGSLQKKLVQHLFRSFHWFALSLCGHCSLHRVFCCFLKFLCWFGYDGVFVSFRRFSSLLLVFKLETFRHFSDDLCLFSDEMIRFNFSWFWCWFWFSWSLNLRRFLFRLDLNFSWFGLNLNFCWLRLDLRFSWFRLRWNVCCFRFRMQFNFSCFRLRLNFSWFWLRLNLNFSWLRLDLRFSWFRLRWKVSCFWFRMQFNFSCFKLRLNFSWFWLRLNLNFSWLRLDLSFSWFWFKLGLSCFGCLSCGFMWFGVTVGLLH